MDLRRALASILMLLGLLFLKSPAVAEGNDTFITDRNPGYFADQKGAVYGFYHIEHATEANFLTVAASVVSSEEAQKGMLVLCIAVSYDAVTCSKAANAVKIGAQVYQTLAVADVQQDIGPSIVPPRGYDLCQVVIDLYSITGQSTFNATILNLDDSKSKDSRGALSGPFYIATTISVPKSNQGKGEWARANFAVQFVPLGDRAVDHCLPDELQLMLAKGPNGIHYDVPERHVALP